MLGVVFTELLEMIEQQFSFEVADAVIKRAGSSGSYTAVGNYPDAELFAIVGALSAETEVEVPALLHAFGNHLFGRFAERYPVFFEGVSDPFVFLAGLESHIHTEVRKLYPASHPPLFVYEDDGAGGAVLDYRSERGLSRLADGLLEACFIHFRVPVTILPEDLSDGAGKHVRYTIQRQVG